MPSANCLFSTVVNVSGATQFFSFLPEHGVKLAANEEYTFIGDPVQACIRNQRVTSGRNLKGLQQALENGALEIKQTPAPILYDETDDVSKMLVLGDGDLYAVDPCWADTEYSSPLSA